MAYQARRWKRKPQFTRRLHCSSALFVVLVSRVARTGERRSDDGEDARHGTRGPGGPEGARAVKLSSRVTSEPRRGPPLSVPFIIPMAVGQPVANHPLPLGFNALWREIRSRALRAHSSGLAQT